MKIRQRKKSKKSKRLIILMVTISLFMILSDNVNAESYEYDKLGRVRKVTYDDGSCIIYEYDANGNITNKKASVVKKPGQEPGSGTGRKPGTGTEPGAGTDPGTGTEPGTGTDPEEKKTFWEKIWDSEMGFFKNVWKWIKLLFGNTEEE